jgi:hypothetical protein
MSLVIIRLLFDTGLLVLIWLVQLVVYPSYTYYTQDNFKRWHDQYTKRVTIIVMPLMLGQLIVIGMQLWTDANWFNLLSGLIVFLLWCATFLKFVPLHNRITNGDFNQETLHDLIRCNWGRTVLWSVLFLISVGEVLF